MGFRVLQRAGGAPDKCRQIPLVKRKVDHLPSKDTLWSSNQSFPVDVRTSINFASASCKDLIVFDKGSHEDPGLQHISQRFQLVVHAILSLLVYQGRYITREFLPDTPMNQLP